MGFFAILREDGEPSCRVRQLDINLWCLPRLFGRHQFFCDIGIRLAQEQPDVTLGRLALAMPFRTDGTLWEDLSDRLLTYPKTAGLVFGEQTQVDGATLRFADGTDFTLARLEREKCSLDMARSTKFFSLWHLTLRRPVRPGGDVYLRTRFNITDLGRTWLWQRAILLQNGALVDIRVTDLRESVIVPQGDDYPDRVVKIDELNCFVIAPASYVLGRASPELRYSRILEGRVWEPYLDRATDLLRRRKISVNFWREVDVSSDNEFRGFLTLARSSSATNWSTVLLAALAAGIAVASLSTPEELTHSIVAKALGSMTRGLKRWAVGLGLTALAVLLIEVLPIGRRLVSRLRSQLITVEHWLYRKRASY